MSTGASSFGSELQLIYLEGILIAALATAPAWSVCLILPTTLLSEQQWDLATTKSAVQGELIIPSSERRVLELLFFFYIHSIIHFWTVKHLRYMNGKKYL